MDITWDQLVEIEPKLGALLAQANKVSSRGNPKFCANKVWYESFRESLLNCVGWHSIKDDPILRSSEAYDIAYNKIYDALPDCRNCRCLG